MDTQLKTEMKKIVKKFLTRLLDKQGHARGLNLGIFLAAGAITGISCVLFMRAFEFVLRHRLDEIVGGWIWVLTPVLFLVAVEFIRRIAPFADGAGIPQAVYAASHLNEKTVDKIYPLVSLRTMVTKIVALLLAVWAGASTGREGPTVHIATCLFLAIVLLAKRFTNLKLDLRSAVIAGGAAGLAAAFNTPLAGVTFAIEELSETYFTTIKEAVLMTIILAGIAAKSLTGEYTYFGRLASPMPVAIGTVLTIGIAGGIFGAFFSTALIEGRRRVLSLRGNFWRYAIPVLFALGLLLVNHYSHLDLLGPGNQVAQQFVANNFQKGAFGFPFAKLAATLLTYWSGIAGGIFAPSLSIGAGLGADIGHLTGDPTTACAVIGMASFLAATIQAPMTAFVIIFEMTGHHQMLLPVMLSSLVAVIIARLFGAKHLYQTLAEFYSEKLGEDVAEAKVKIQNSID